MPLSELVPSEYNPRKIDDKAMEGLKASLKRFGVVQPIVWNKQTGKIVGGHQRVKALAAQGAKEAPVIVVDIDEKEEMALNLTLNNPDIEGVFTEDALSMLSEMQMDFDQFEDLGLDMLQDDLSRAFPDWTPDNGLAGNNGIKDEPPEPPVNPISKLGELWSLGDHRLLCGDSTKQQDVDRLMDSQKAELLFTSPPYSDMRDYGGGKDLTVANLINFISSYSDYAEYQVINLGLKRKDNEVVQYWDEYIKKAKECDYKFLSWNIWSREGMGGSVANMSAMFRMEHEWIFVFGKERKKLNNTKKNKSAGLHTGISNRQKDGTTKKVSPKTVKEYGRLSSVLTMCYGNSQNHPAVFPVAFPEEYIKAMTNVNDYVVDPFGGSGSTLIACEKTNRKFFGMELDPRYIDVILTRYTQFVGKDPVREDGVTWSSLQSS